MKRTTVGKYDDNRGQKKEQKRQPQPRSPFIFDTLPERKVPLLFWIYLFVLSQTKPGFIDERKKKLDYKTKTPRVLLEK